ncbi:hypothetical protein IV494_14510 [Kaistella sp. G5-32]|uniref:Tetratricopeptide repeat protein n=1 Tax=Kaistella gelatinilytica TaxID=2787636 RepID=A0ABS0FFF4_9FLAO|nr:hypothetical protein [Kaistella gelatinilytica]MBF8458393.1 hypothetical protein [Kaistella gelatinilytica]
MLKNKKMHRLSLILILFSVLHSCKGDGQIKDHFIVEKKTGYEIKKIGYSILQIDDKLIIKNSDSSVIYNSERLIRNFSALSTTFKKGLSNDFLLVYENNATSEKIQIAYHYFIENDKLFFISKEQVKYNFRNIFISKNYYKPINATNLTYEDLDEKTDFKNDKISEYSTNNLKNYIMLDSKPAFNLEFKYNPQDFFIDYPIDIFKISNINFIDVKNSNDIAFYLQQAKICDESIFILTKIIDKFPDRAVAYLNLGDAYWLINKKSNAKESYKKYISLMKSQKKDLSKIPKVVNDRIGEN